MALSLDTSKPLTVEYGLEQLRYSNCQNYIYADEFGQVESGVVPSLEDKDQLHIRDHVFCYVPKITQLLHDGKYIIRGYKRPPHSPEVLLKLQDELLRTTNLQLGLYKNTYTPDQQMGLYRLIQKLEKPITAASVATQNTWLTTVISLIVKTGCAYTPEEQKATLEHLIKLWGAVKYLAGGLECNVPSLTIANVDTWTKASRELCKIGEKLRKLYDQLALAGEKPTDVGMPYNLIYARPEYKAAEAEAKARRAAGDYNSVSLEGLITSLQKVIQAESDAKHTKKVAELTAKYLGTSISNVVPFKSA